MNKFDMRLRSIFFTPATLAVALALGGCSRPATPEAAVKVSAVMTVELASAEKRVFDDYLAATGEIVPFQEAFITAEVTGFSVKEVLADVGDVVERGQVLARLDTSSLAIERDQQQARVQEAHLLLEQAEREWQRAQQLLSENAVSRQSVEQLRDSFRLAQVRLAQTQAALAQIEQRLQRTELKAPYSGVITKRNIAVGQVLSATTPAFGMIREGLLMWVAEVDPRELARVRRGQMAEVELPGGELVPGSVLRIEPLLKEGTRMAKVWVSLKASAQLRAGLLVEGRIRLGERTAWAVPQQAVVNKEGQHFLLVVKDSRVQRLPIQTRASTQGWVELEWPLDRAVPRFIAEGVALLREGDVVRVPGDAAEVR